MIKEYTVLQMKRKLEKNKKNGKSPQNIKELTKHLGFSRASIYYAMKSDRCPDVDKKVRKWIREE